MRDYSLSKCSGDWNRDRQVTAQTSDDDKDAVSLKVRGIVFYELNEFEILLWRLTWLQAAKPIWYVNKIFFKVKQ